jgi:tripartite-type tricarboxylate transporter receptor subunit TctC
MKTAGRHISLFSSLFLVLNSVAACMAPGAASAQAPSSKTVSMRVAYPAGGPADVAARKTQVLLQSSLGQTVIVENVPGASGAIAAANVLNAASDGNTLLVTTGNDLILAPLAMAQVKYKPESYRLLGVLSITDFTLVTNAQHAFSSIDELVEAARKKPQKEITFGSWGYGSAPYLVAADFAASTGARVLDVPYKGAAPVIQALLGNEIDMAFVPLAPNVLELVRQGKIKAIGSASATRSPYLSGLPTLNEGKYLKQFVYSAWAALFAPASVPDPLAIRLNQSLVEVKKSEDFKRFLAESAALPDTPMTLAQADTFYRGEMQKFRAIAKAINLQAQ